MITVLVCYVLGLLTEHFILRRFGWWRKWAYRTPPKAILLLFAAAALLRAQPAGSGVCTVSNTQTTGQVLTATNNQKGCSWQAVAGTGTVTSVGLVGTANQITVTGASPITTNGSWTLTLPAGLIFPGTTTFTAGTTGVPSFNIPSGVAKTTPASGDFWNLSGVLQYYDGTTTQSLMIGSGLTSNQLLIGGGGSKVAALGSLGTTTTVYHGNAGGAGSFGNIATGDFGANILAVANGGTNLASGTSGGILGYTASGTLASSAALTANLPVIGGGAGATPTVGTVSGNTTQFVTTTGTQTSTAVAKIDASGNHIASGWTIDANNNLAGPTSSTGYTLFKGVTSGGFGYTVNDVAGGGTGTLYVLPTAVSSGQFLKDNGSTTCPTLPTGAPTTCEAVVWASPAGSGTVSSSTIGQVPVYTAATTVTGNANLTFSGSTETVGASGATGCVAFVGATSGTTTVCANATAGGNLTWPTATGTVVEDTATLTAGGMLYGGGNHVASATAAATTKQMWISGGSGAPTAIDFPQVLDIPAANCNNATGGAGWSIGSGGTVACRAGTNNLGGYISITDTSSTFATFQVYIPQDWDTATNPYIRFQIASTDAVNAHTIIPSIQVACYKGDGSTTDDVAANAAHSLSTTTLNGNANRFWSTSNVQMNSTDMTGCVAGARMQVTVGRATDTATNAEFYGASITFPRLLTVQAN